jgi:hypothetical protein
MIAIHEINQVIMVNTEFGLAQALFIIDYGIHTNTIWLCASICDGKIRHFDSNQITIQKNNTINLNLENK